MNHHPNMNEERKIVSHARKLRGWLRRLLSWLAKSYAHSSRVHRDVLEHANERYRRRWEDFGGKGLL